MTNIIKGIQPDTNSGIVFIEMFISSVACLNFESDPQLKQIIKNRISHPTNKAAVNNISSIFLNLDNANQLKFLSICGFQDNLINLPAIENWQEFGDKLGMSNWAFSMEDVRNNSIFFLNDWDAYSHVVVWIRRFLLFANNNEISDSEYPGEKFGSYPNWAEYFMQMPIEKKQAFVNKLINYK